VSDDTLLEASGILLTWSPDPQGDAVYSLTGGGDLYAMYDGTWDTKQLEAADGSWRLDSSGWAKPRVTIRRTDAEAEAGTLWWRGYGAELVVSSGVRYRWRYGFLHRDFEIVDAAGTPLLKFGIQAWPQANTPSASAAGGCDDGTRSTISRPDRLVHVAASRARHGDLGAHLLRRSGRRLRALRWRIWKYDPQHHNATHYPRDRGARMV